MATISIHEAQSNLSELIHRLAPGDEIVITEDDRPVARLTAASRPRRRLARRGSSAGRCCTWPRTSMHRSTISRNTWNEAPDRCARFDLVRRSGSLAESDRPLPQSRTRRTIGCCGAGTIWEIAIKAGLKKLNLSRPYRPWIEQAITGLAVTILPITVEHADVQAGLPHHHRDPFDRLLVAQALVENMPVVSADAQLDAYGINRLW